MSISKYQSNFAKKDCTPNWSKDSFAIKRVKNTMSRTYVINNLNGAKIVERFDEKKRCKKQNKKSLESKK